MAKILEDYGSDCLSSDVSPAGSQVWGYESELELAAELGKTLLERNRELESELQQLHRLNQEQQMEIHLMAKQQETVRELNESRMKVYEEVDKAMQELEQENQHLNCQGHADKQRIQRLMKTVDELEVRCDSLQRALDEAKESDRRRRKEKRERRKTVAVPSLKEITDLQEFLAQHQNDIDLKSLLRDPYEAEIRSLQETVTKLRAQQSMDRRKHDKLETEISLLVQENQSMEVKLKEYSIKTEKAHDLHQELEAAEISAGKICHKCGNKLEEGVPESKVEHDVQEVDDKKCQVLSTPEGAFIYGSRDGLEKIGFKANEAPPVDPGVIEISLFGEMEAQYRILVSKYEALKNRRCKRAVRNASVEANLPSKDETEKEERKKLRNHRSRRRDRSPPEYKKLFEEIFQTLKRSSSSADLRCTGSDASSVKTSNGIGGALK